MAMAKIAQAEPKQFRMSVAVAAVLIGAVVGAVLLETISFAVFFMYSAYVNEGLSLAELATTSYGTTGYLYHKRGARAGEVEYFAIPSLYLGYRLKPNAAFFSLDPASGERIYPIYSNRYGFIANNNDASKEPAVDDSSFNIFVTGGSTVQGSGATRNSATFVAVLERMLNAQVPLGGMLRKPIRVINAGVGGYNSSQELIYMLFELQHMAPGMFIMFNGINENFDSDQQHMGRGYHFNSQMAPTELDRLPFSVLPAFQWVTVRLLSRFGAVDRWSFEPGVSEPQIAIRPVDERYAAVIAAAAAAISQAADVPFIYALQPTSGAGNRSYTPDELERRDQFSGHSDRRWELYEQRVRQFYSKMASRIDALRETNDDNPRVVFLDASGILDHSQESVYWDARHYTDHGHSVIAAYLRAIITERFGDLLYSREG